MLKDGATVKKCLTELTTRFLGIVRDWFVCLGEYRRMLFCNSPNFQEALAVIHMEFIGDVDAYTKAQADEYLARKCCSLRRIDLEKHFGCLSPPERLQRSNNEECGHFISTQPEINRMLRMPGIDLANTTLGQINQMCYAALDKICETQQSLKELFERGRRIKSYCDKSRIQIGCKENKCSCSKKKKNAYKKEE